MNDTGRVLVYLDGEIIRKFSIDLTIDSKSIVKKIRSIVENLPKNTEYSICISNTIFQEKYINNQTDLSSFDMLTQLAYMKQVTQFKVEELTDLYEDVIRIVGNTIK